MATWREYSGNIILAILGTPKWRGIKWRHNSHAMLGSLGGEVLDDA